MAEDDVVSRRVKENLRVTSIALFICYQSARRYEGTSARKHRNQSIPEPRLSLLAKHWNQSAIHRLSRNRTYDVRHLSLVDTRKLAFAGTTGKDIVRRTDTETPEAKLQRRFLAVIDDRVDQVTCSTIGRHVRR